MCSTEFCFRYCGNPWIQLCTLHPSECTGTFRNNVITQCDNEKNIHLEYLNPTHGHLNFTVGIWRHWILCSLLIIYLVPFPAFFFLMNWINRRCASVEGIQQQLFNFNFSRGWLTLLYCICLCRSLECWSWALDYGFYLITRVSLLFYVSALTHTHTRMHAHAGAHTHTFAHKRHPTATSWCDNAL